MTTTAPTATISITLTLARETRTLECSDYGDKAFGPALAVYGVFPTGRKAHRATPMLWKVDGSFRVPHRATIGTDETGQEWMLDHTLYTHNSNRGRIVGWSDAVAPEHIARW